MLAVCVEVQISVFPFQCFFCILQKNNHFRFIQSALKTQSAGSSSSSPVSLDRLSGTKWNDECASDYMIFPIVAEENICQNLHSLKKSCRPEVETEECCLYTRPKKYDLAPHMKAFGSLKDSHRSAVSHKRAEGGKKKKTQIALNNKHFCNWLKIPRQSRRRGVVIMTIGWIASDG